MIKSNVHVCDMCQDGLSKGTVTIKAFAMESVEEFAHEGCSDCLLKILDIVSPEDQGE